MNIDKNTSLVQVLLSIVILGLAFAVLGYVVGIFVGRSGHDSAVVAALIPAVLTLAGGFIIFKTSDLHFAIGASSVISFSFALLWGATTGSATLMEDTQATQQEKIDHFRRCSHEEQAINSFRVEILNLPPLPSKIFCG